MGLSFANPAAAWALLGIPVVLAIHFLQSRSRRVEISTLFLLDLLPEETRSGAVFTRLRNGLQLWLQLLAVLLLSLLLARPMWLRAESLQNVALVIDSSLSMRAFHDRMIERLEALLPRIQRSAGRSNWFVLPSDPALPLIHRGEDTEAVLAALRTHQARGPGHDPRAALLRARELIGPEGLLIFVTDHPPASAPSAAVVLGVGEPIDNSTFGGIRFENGNEWLLSVLHFGSQPAERNVRILIDNTESEPIPARLQPGAVLTLRGVLPEGVQRGRFRLDGDALDADNDIPFVLPRLKKITWSAPTELLPLAERVMATVPASEVSADGLLPWRVYDGALPDASGHGLFFPLPGENAPFAQILAEDHDLTRDLSWQGFLGSPRSFSAQRPGDQVLVWMGEVPLILLRENARDSQLIFTFDPATSNIDRLPAFVLLLHRFCERLRDGLEQPEARILETRERLPLHRSATRYRFSDLEGRLSENEVIPLRAPDVPGTLQLWRGVDLLLDAAVIAADAAESDLRQAASVDLPPELLLQRREQHSETDFLSSLWFVLLLSAVTGSWLAAKR